MDDGAGEIAKEFFLSHKDIRTKLDDMIPGKGGYLPLPGGRGFAFIDYRPDGEAYCELCNGITFLEKDKDVVHKFLHYRKNHLKCLSMCIESYNTMERSNLKEMRDQQYPLYYRMKALHLTFSMSTACLYCKQFDPQINPYAAEIDYLQRRFF